MGLFSTGAAPEGLHRNLHPSSHLGSSVFAAVSDLCKPHGMKADTSVVLWVQCDPESWWQRRQKVRIPLTAPFCCTQAVGDQENENKKEMVGNKVM